MVHIRTQHETTPSGPQNTWESEYVKKNVKLEAISKNTLQKYMHLLTKKVEQEIIKAMPEKIALIVDGWTSGSTHYLGVMASFCDMDQNVEVPLFPGHSFCRHLIIWNGFLAQLVSLRMTTENQLCR